MDQVIKIFLKAPIDTCKPWNNKTTTTTTKFCWTKKKKKINPVGMPSFLRTALNWTLTTCSRLAWHLIPFYDKYQEKKKFWTFQWKGKITKKIILQKYICALIFFIHFFKTGVISGYLWNILSKKMICPNFIHFFL